MKRYLNKFSRFYVMNSHKYAVLLLLLVSLASAFDATEYFYSSESDVTVSYMNFTVDGTEYSIVRFDGVDTFLLSGDTPVTDQNDIEDIIHAHYRQSNYPSEEEIQELKDLVQEFNDSRNDGYDWKNKEEYLCRNDVLFANGKITVSGEPVTCVDEETCQQNALLLYAAYGEGLGLGSAEPLYDALYDFAPSSFAMDHILGNYSEQLENLNESNIEYTLNYIEGTVDDLREYSDDIESTIFRTPRRNDSEDKEDCYLSCFALCPSFDLDQDVLDDLEDAASDLSDKIAPLAGYVGTSSTIYSNTLARMNYSITESLAFDYTNQFTALNSSAAVVIPRAEEATTRVLNTTVYNDLDRLKQLRASIPDDIEVRDFSTTEQDIGNFSLLLESVNSSSIMLLEQYNKTRNAKNLANSLIIVLETKDLDPVSMGSLELLKNRTADLDAAFRDGLTLAQLAELEVNYTTLLKDGQELLKKETDMPANRVLLLFRGFARNVNEGIAHVAEDTEVISPQEIPDNKIVTLGAFSLLLFISLASIVALVFLYIIATTKFIIPKTGPILASAFVSVIVLLLGFSAFTYLFLSKTSTEATLTEFLADFESKDSTAIVVDLQETSYSDALAMNACASSLANTFSDRNKSWTIYRVSGSSCTAADESGQETTMSVSECLDAASNETSTFELGYSSSNEPPQFSVIYTNKANIKANLDYYESCPLVSLFS
jgi:hypothetical protein